MAKRGTLLLRGGLDFSNVDAFNVNARLRPARKHDIETSRPQHRGAVKRRDQSGNNLSFLEFGMRANTGKAKRITADPNR
jgi:hypothetical protein